MKKNNPTISQLRKAAPKLYKALKQLVWAVETQSEGNLQHALAYAKFTALYEAEGK